MNSGLKGKKSEEYYTPNPVLKGLIRDLLQVHAKQQELKKKKHAGEGIDLEEKDALAVLENKTNRKKNNALNKHVFQSMANLTFLLEEMQKKPYIRERFEDDIKVLFFTESNKIPKDPIFLRFLIACVLKYERGKARSTDKTPDFRYILGEYMQRAVMILMQEAGPHKSDLDAFLVKKLDEEVLNAFSWVKVFAQQPRRDLDSYMKKRPALYKQRPALF